ncbi:ISAzo13-like element transposase-related protein [Phormidesmis priestleyi]
MASPVQGVILHTVQLLQDLIATTTTRTGLKVFTTILDKPYQTGRKVAESFKSTMKIVFDPHLPQWNYTARPELQVI